MFHRRIATIDPQWLSAPNQLDREQLLHEIDSRLLTLEVVKPWATDPDSYSSGLASTAYVMIQRTFACRTSGCGPWWRAKSRCPLR